MNYEEMIKSQEIPEKIEPIKALETNHKGELVEVQPKSVQNNNSLIIPMAPPKDQFTYYYSHYSSTTNTRNRKFHKLGEYSVSNSRNRTVTGQYTQESSKTTSWTVGSNISGETKIGNAFLGEISAKWGLSASKTKTTVAGAKYGVSFSVPPKKMSIATAYRHGGKSTGKLTWKKYSPSGTQVGIYTEIANGTAVDSNGIHINVATK